MKTDGFKQAHHSNRTDRYLSVSSVDKPPLPAHSHKRVPRGWSAVPIGGPDEALVLHWAADELSLISLPADHTLYLRIGVAIEIRENQIIEAYLPETGTVLGTFDVRYAYVFQPFELRLSTDHVFQIAQQGIALRMIAGTEPLWIFDQLDTDEQRRAFTPHLAWVGCGDRLERCVEQTLSLSSLQPFGWLEGCVLDGMYDLRRVVDPQEVDQALSLHLRQFIDDQGQLYYEDLFGMPSDGHFSGIESTLPVAILAKIDPHHPVVSQAVAYWMSKRDEDGMISDGGTLTCEGTYTIGYAMAVAAAQLGLPELAYKAVDQVLIRQRDLTDGRDLYLINKGRGKERLFRNWSRGYAWYMIGMVRIQLALRDTDLIDRQSLDHLAAETKRMAEGVMSWRQADGLWACFLDSPSSGTETSGSAGIATALALAAKHGIIGHEWMQVAEEVRTALVDYLTPDGYLHGVTQHNAGGEVLQRSGYRVISQMGMGLLMQLHAALSEGTIIWEGHSEHDRMD